MVLTVMSIAQWHCVTLIGGLKNVRMRVITACIVSWLLIVGSGTFYLSFTYTRGLRLRNNMCLITAMSHQQNVSSFEYIFQWVVIILDLCLLVTLTTSMFGLLFKVLQSSRSVQSAAGRGAKRSATALRTAQRVTMLLVCNALCWLPLITICILMFVGITIHENVLLWVTILLIPICATVDPVLYGIGLCKSRKKPVKM